MRRRRRIYPHTHSPGIGTTAKPISPHRRILPRDNNPPATLTWMLRMFFAPMLHPCLPYVYRWGWQDHLHVLPNYIHYVTAYAYRCNYIHYVTAYAYRWGWQDHLRVLEAVAVRAHALLNSHIA